MPRPGTQLPHAASTAIVTGAVGGGPAVRVAADVVGARVEHLRNGVAEVATRHDGPVDTR